MFNTHLEVEFGGFEGDGNEVGRVAPDARCGETRWVKLFRKSPAPTFA